MQANVRKINIKNSVICKLKVHLSGEALLHVILYTKRELESEGGYGFVCNETPQFEEGL